MTTSQTQVVLLGIPHHCNRELLKLQPMAFGWCTNLLFNECLNYAFTLFSKEVHMKNHPNFLRTPGPQVTDPNLWSF